VWTVLAAANWVALTVMAGTPADPTDPGTLRALLGIPTLMLAAAATPAVLARLAVAIDPQARHH
jgi:hypothetical protein